MPDPTNKNIPHDEWLALYHKKYNKTFWGQAEAGLRLEGISPTSTVAKLMQRCLFV